MDIRKVEANQIDELIEVGRESYRETFSPIIPKDDLNKYLEGAFDKKVILDEIKNPDSQFWMIYKDGVAGGYIKLNEPNAHTEKGFGDSMELQRIYVLKAFHRQGIGTELMAKAVAVAKNMGYKSLWLGVLDSDIRANSFYKSMGFKKVGSHPFIMGGIQVSDDLLIKNF